MNKKLRLILLLLVAFILGCMFTINWVMHTEEGKAFAKEKADQEIWKWFPNLPR